MKTAIESRVVESLVLAEPGMLSPDEYSAAMRDLAAYLDYVGEPVQLKRKSIRRLGDAVPGHLRADRLFAESRVLA